MPSLPKGRTLQEFQPLRLAEAKILHAVAAGEYANIGESRPEPQSHACAVRAEFLRFLALGGDENAPVHEQGIIVQGAWITGTLDLMFAEIRVPLMLVDCRFEAAPVLYGTQFHGLFSLHGSCVPGLDADGLQCHAGMHMKSGFEALGEVRLPGAKIGGDLVCSGGRFENPNGYALNADRITVSGAVLLNNGFQAQGEVRLYGAKIGGNLDCSGGQFENPKGYAISAESMSVFGTFYFRGVKIKGGTVNLAFAHVTRLIDDLQSWPHGIVLDGFVYDTFRSALQSQANATSAPTQAKERLEWLDKQSSEHSGKAKKSREFRPQPWQQLRKVLQDDGHYEDARRVAIAFEKRKWECGVIGEISPRAESNFIVSAFDWLRSRATRFFHALYGGIIGYGYRPLRLLGIVVMFWILSATVFHYAAQNNLFVPSDPAHIGLLEKPAFDACNPEKTPSGNWTSCTTLPPDYPSFYSPVYALDVMLPITKLGQEDHWTLIDPRKAKTTCARALAWFTQIWAWIGTLFSWGVGAMLLATFTNLPKRQDE